MVRRIVKEDLELKSLRRTRRHAIPNEERRFIKAQRALDWLEQHPNSKMCWSDEKIFSVDEHSNPSAQRFLAPSRKFAGQFIEDDIRHTTKNMGAKTIMVYIALFTTGEYFMFMYEPRERINAEKYCDVL